MHHQPITNISSLLRQCLIYIFISIQLSISERTVSDVHDSSINEKVYSIHPSLMFVLGVCNVCVSGTCCHNSI